jgi:hypothetical protein
MLGDASNSPVDMILRGAAGAAVEPRHQAKDRQSEPTRQSDFGPLPCISLKDVLRHFGIACARAPRVVTSPHRPKLTTLLAGWSVAEWRGVESPEPSVRGLGQSPLVGVPSSVSRSDRFEAAGARGAGFPSGAPLIHLSGPSRRRSQASNEQNHLDAGLSKTKLSFLRDLSRVATGRRGVDVDQYVSGVSRERHGTPEHDTALLYLCLCCCAAGCAGGRSPRSAGRGEPCVDVGGAFAAVGCWVVRRVWWCCVVLLLVVLLTAESS